MWEWDDVIESFTKRGQRGRGMGSLFNFTKKLAKNPMVRNLGKMALKELPGVYNKGVKKLKNKN